MADEQDVSPASTPINPLHPFFISMRGGKAGLWERLDGAVEPPAMAIRVCWLPTPGRLPVAPRREQLHRRHRLGKEKTMSPRLGKVFGTLLAAR